MDRGPVYSFYYSRDRQSRSTDVTIQVAFAAPGIDPAAPAFDPKSKLFLVAEFDKVVEITNANGMVVSVRSLNV